MTQLYPNLNPQKALIWRIVHRANLPWILEHGLHCGNSLLRSANWVSIGSSELITKRAIHPVPCAPGGYLNDYVPFYFTPFSVMLLNIKTGRGVPQQKNEDILILVSSMHRVHEAGLPYVFTNMHAYSALAQFYSDLKDLKEIDWPLLQRRDFKRDQDDLAKFERYQAEALIYQHVPVDSLLGVICYTEAVKQDIEQQIRAHGASLQVHVRQDWYF